MMIESLNVCSGTDSLHHVKFQVDNVIHVNIEKHAFYAEVVCDAHQLPFRDNSFDIVHIFNFPS